MAETFERVNATDALAKVLEMNQANQPKEGEEKKAKEPILMREVASELGIRDWYPTVLSGSSLYSMEGFLREAVKLGCKEVEFVAGAKGAKDQGMWAYTGNGEDYIFHTFSPDKNNWSFSIKGKTPAAPEELTTKEKFEGCLLATFFN